MRHRLWGAFLATTLFLTVSVALGAGAAHLPCTFSATGPSTDGVLVYGSTTLSCGSVGRTGDWVEVEIWEDDTWPDPDDLKSELRNDLNALTMAVHDNWNCNGTGTQTYYLRGYGHDTSGTNYSLMTGTYNLTC